MLNFAVTIKPMVVFGLLKTQYSGKCFYCKQFFMQVKCVVRVWLVSEMTKVFCCAVGFALNVE